MRRGIKEVAGEANATETNDVTGGQQAQEEAAAGRVPGSRKRSQSAAGMRYEQQHAVLRAEASARELQITRDMQVREHDSWSEPICSLKTPPHGTLSMAAGGGVIARI